MRSRPSSGLRWHSARVGVTMLQPGGRRASAGLTGRLETGGLPRVGWNTQTHRSEGLTVMSSGPRVLLDTLVAAFLVVALGAVSWFDRIAPKSVTLPPEVSTTKTEEV